MPKNLRKPKKLDRGLVKDRRQDCDWAHAAQFLKYPH
jgi:hypothetical protein